MKQATNDRAAKLKVEMAMLKTREFDKKNTMAPATLVPEEKITGSFLFCWFLFCFVFPLLTLFLQGLLANLKSRLMCLLIGVSFVENLCGGLFFCFCFLFLFFFVFGLFFGLCRFSRQGYHCYVCGKVDVHAKCRKSMENNCKK